MPTYDFRCSACKRAFSVTMTWTEFDKRRGKAKCPKCKKTKNVQQVIGTPLAKTSKKS